MALWKAVSDRYELLLATWNSGRVGATELMRMSTLIWGRLDASTASGLSVSLPEACRLSDALLSQLRVKLGLDPSGTEITERIRQLRAQMERIREQIDLEPAGAPQQQAALEQSRLARRLKEARGQGQPGRRCRGTARTLGNRRCHFRARSDRQWGQPARRRSSRDNEPGNNAPTSRRVRRRCTASSRSVYAASTPRLAMQCPRLRPSGKYRTPATSWRTTCAASTRCLGR